ncbi:MAG: hypothetical protein NC187_03855 [Candidatus Amulumruptor caecigallinarius]|nr:hypothetical protein [Candidatus Amulumruptor caecigallinarius]MCM1396607.1 hypothetical protein [Candidatus Amulumruptor caecigallinarius]MCM1453335.1 hypothetical protein [bacterium]
MPFLPRIPGMKRFLTRTAIGSLPVVAVLCLCVYYFYNIHPYLNGDLGRLGRIAFDANYNIVHHRDPFPGSRMVRDYHDGDTLTRVITIGDSFSQQDSLGYQNALGNLLGETVTNIPVPSATSGPVEQSVALLRSGFFDRNKGAEYIIFELVERDFTEHLSEINEAKVSASPVTFPSTPAQSAPPAAENLVASIVHQGVDWLRLVTGLEHNPVRHVSLTQPLFTQPGRENMLYFYKNDLSPLGASPEQWQAMRANIEMLHEEFGRRGLKMIFLVIPDKYEVYQNYAEPGVWPLKPFGREMLDALAPLPYVVQVLPEAKARLAAGEKDLYLADDSHWGAKGSMMTARLLLPRVTPTDSVR